MEEGQEASMAATMAVLLPLLLLLLLQQMRISDWWVQLVQP